LQHRLAMVKWRRWEYLEDLGHTEMPAVYEALNAVQSTGWRINRPVYDAVAKLGQEFIEKGPEHDSQVASLKGALRVAERFLDGVGIYFPQTMDWRGRLYPVPIDLNPQGDDAVRSLLTFANGKPITTQAQVDWLAIHGANCYGIDKVSFDDRIRWVKEHEQRILASAATPFLSSNRNWWSKADNGEKAFQFLAFCIEWSAFQRAGFGFTSSLPVAMDGTCNGLQHFSAMLRDENGGSAVNLTPSEVPQDIYQRVADRVVEILVSRKDEIAQMWLGFGISRSLVKQSVMTLPYGATSSGRRESIREEIGWKAGVSGKAVSYLEKCVKQAIDETVKAAPEAMHWLQDVARIMSKRGLPVHWVTVARFPVSMLEIKRASVEIRSRGKRIRFLQQVEPV
jgi:DNA-directed RNA polymerase, mitochondrial